MNIVVPVAPVPGPCSVGVVLKHILATKNTPCSRDFVQESWECNWKAISVDSIRSLFFQVIQCYRGVIIISSLSPHNLSPHLSRAVPCPAAATGHCHAVGQGRCCKPPVRPQTPPAILRARQPFNGQLYVSKAMRGVSTRVSCH